MVRNMERVVWVLWTKDGERLFATAQVHDDKRPVRHCPDYFRPPLRALGCSAIGNRGQRDEGVSTFGRSPDLVDIGCRRLSHSLTEIVAHFADSLLLKCMNRG